MPHPGFEPTTSGASAVELVYTMDLSIMIIVNFIYKKKLILNPSEILYKSIPLLKVSVSHFFCYYFILFVKTLVGT